MDSIGRKNAKLEANTFFYFAGIEHDGWKTGEIPREILTYRSM